VTVFDGGGNTNIQSNTQIYIQSTTQIYIQSTTQIYIQSTTQIYIQSNTQISLLGGSVRSIQLLMSEVHMCFVFVLQPVLSVQPRCISLTVQSRAVGSWFITPTLRQ